MMVKAGLLTGLGIILALTLSCRKMKEEATNNYQRDLSFLNRYQEVVELKDEMGKARVLIVPAYQGRVMTSTSGGLEGISYGWINYDLISSRKLLPHINPFGGEDRFWMGPEGGQYSIFFRKGDPFDLQHWQTPVSLDTEPFQVVEQSKRQVIFEKDFSLENYSGSRFDLKVKRKIRLLNREEVGEILQMEVPENIGMVAFQSENTVFNTGTTPWTRETGLLSIWILGMFNPSEQATVIIPYEKGTGPGYGITSDYFGPVPPERLKINDQVVFFRADGEMRGKIGLGAGAATDWLGSFDPANQVLTLVNFNKKEKELPYVNSQWKIQDEPYLGDVVNSYNDGPPEPGKKPMGPFYELETSSPAAELSPGDSIRHIHTTFHFEGNQEELDYLIRNKLKVNAAAIINAFSH
jgi:hypothetical protein